MAHHIVPVEGYGDDTVAGVHNRRLNFEVVPVMQSFEQAQPGVVASPDWDSEGASGSDEAETFVLDPWHATVETGVPFISKDPGINRTKAAEFPQEVFMDVDDILAFGKLTQI